MKEEGALQALMHGKCPRCRTGKMYKGHTYNLSRLGKMNETCASCGFKFEIEPGFFFGAMFISYIFSVGLFLITFFCLYLFANDPDIISYVLTVTVLSAATYPLNLRYSRILFLHLFGGVRYDPSKLK